MKYRALFVTARNRTSSNNGLSVAGANGSTGGGLSITNGSSTAASSAVAALEKNPDSDGGRDGPVSSSNPAQLVAATKEAGSAGFSGVGSSGGRLN